MHDGRGQELQTQCRKAEVDKFMRDMNANPGYTCGVLVSLNSGISGWKDFSLGNGNWTSNSVPA